MHRSSRGKFDQDNDREALFIFMYDLKKQYRSLDAQKIIQSADTRYADPPEESSTKTTTGKYYLFCLRFKQSKNDPECRYILTKVRTWQDLEE